MLKEFLTEDNGQLSSMRLVTTAWSLGTLAVWIYTSMTQGQMLPIEGTQIGMTAAVLGAKVAQKFAENKVK
jgi:hypothetical protein